MLFINKETINKDENNMAIDISNEINYINTIIDTQEKNKKFVLSYMQKFAESSDPINPIYANQIRLFLEDLKSNLDLIESNINSLNTLVIELDNIYKNDFDYNEFNNKYLKILLESQEKISKFEAFSFKIFNNYFDFKILDSDDSSNSILSFGIEENNVLNEIETIVSNNSEVSNETPNIDLNNSNSETAPVSDNSENSNEIPDADLNNSNSETTPVSDNSENSNEIPNADLDNSNLETAPASNISDDSDTASKFNLDDFNNFDKDFVFELKKASIPENTLYISESQELVYLPYKNKDLEKRYKKTPSLSIDYIIKKNYSIPYSNYKYTALSRFKEAFSLMRHKEHASIVEAFDLGMELFFNTRLHPAIISACDNLDELDMYLDYLDSKEPEKFKNFNIVFDITPIKIQKK